MEFFVFKRLQFTTHDAAEERLEMDRELPVVPNDGGERETHFHIHRELFFQLADECGGGRFAGIDLSTRKFPQASQVLSRRAETGEKSALRIFNHSANNL